MTFQNVNDVNEELAGASVMMNNPNARQRFAQGNSSSNSNNNNNRPSSSYHHHHHQRRTKRSNNNSITTINIIKRATKNKTKICLVALLVFILFVNLMVFSRDSEARLMSSGRKYAKKKDAQHREELSHEDYDFGSKDEKGRKKDDSDDSDDSDEKPSLETALLGSALAVDSPTLTSGFKSLSYPSLAEVGDSKRTFLVAFEGNWEWGVPKSLTNRELDQRKIEDINESRGGHCYVSRGRVLPIQPGSDVAPKEQWHAPKMAVKGTSSNDKCWRPQLFVVPQTHEVLLFYKRGASRETWEGFLKRSLDGGKTWLEEEKLPPGILGPSKNKVLRNSEDESILSASERWTRSSACAWIERAEREGRDWTVKSGPIRMEKKGLQERYGGGRMGDKAAEEEARDYGGIEPAIFYKDDGTLVVLARPAKTTERFPKSLSGVVHAGGRSKQSSRYFPKMLKAELKDEPNAQWSAFKEIADLPLPTVFGRGFDVEKLTDGRVMLVMNDPGKKGVSVKISRDDGETFREAFVIEDGDDEDESSGGSSGSSSSYTRDPVIHVANDAMIHVVYVANNGKKIKRAVLDPEQL